MSHHLVIPFDYSLIIHRYSLNTVTLSEIVIHLAWSSSHCQAKTFDLGPEQPYASYAWRVVNEWSGRALMLEISVLDSADSPTNRVSSVKRVSRQNSHNTYKMSWRDVNLLILFLAHIFPQTHKITLCEWTNGCYSYSTSTSFFPFQINN